MAAVLEELTSIPASLTICPRNFIVLLENSHSGAGAQCVTGCSRDNSGAAHLQGPEQRHCSNGQKKTFRNVSHWMKLLPWSWTTRMEVMTVLLSQMKRIIQVILTSILVIPAPMKTGQKRLVSIHVSSRRLEVLNTLSKYTV